MKHNITGAVLALASLSSCAVETEPAIETNTLHQALGATGGDVPVPWDSVKDQSSWDGTFSELAYTDALAKCALSQRMAGGYPNSIALQDTTIAWLLAKMVPAIDACPAALTYLSQSSTLDLLDRWSMAWAVARNDASCNRDVASGTALSARLDVDTGSESGAQSAYWVPDEAELQAAAYSGAYLARARDEARDQVEYAWINGCIAQNLRQHLESSQVAFVSSYELTELQRFIMERASGAVYQYSLLFRAFRELSGWSANIDNPKKYLRIVGFWAKSLTDDQKRRLGEDFALAVDATVEAATQRANLLMRTPEAQDTFGKYDAEGWLEGGRAEVLESLYGLFNDYGRRAATVDMSAPEIGVLLGLARAADALVIGAKSGRFDLAADAKRLLRAVEERVRQNECEAEGDTDSVCWTVSSTEAIEDYRINADFNIHVAHAEALLKGMVEFSLGGPLKGRETSLWAYCDESPEHDCDAWELPADFGQRLAGSHDYQGNFASTAGGILHVDKDFRLAPLASSRHMAQTWAYVPTETLSLWDPPGMQGFQFISEWALHDPGFDDGSGILYTNWATQTRPPRRTVGAVPILALARDTLSRIGPSAGAALWDAALPALNVIEQAVGESQLTFYPRYDYAWSNDSEQCRSYYNGWGFFDPLTGLPGDVLSPIVAAPGSAGCWVYQRVSGAYRVYAASTSDATQPSALHIAPMPSVLSVGASVSPSFQPASGASPFLDSRHYDISYLNVPAGNSDLRISGADGGEVTLFRGKLEPENGQVDALKALVDFWPDCTVALIAAGELCALPWQRVWADEAAPASFRGRAPYFAMHTPSNRGRIVTTGGSLNELADRAWAFQQNDWSKPQYDGMGLRTDWTPVGDAVLHGGQPGEEAYQFFLRKASDAAEEATTAIAEALGQLEEQALDEFALRRSDAKAEELTELEVQSICGELGVCTSDTQRAVIPVMPCADQNLQCLTGRGALQRLLGDIVDGLTGYPLALPVASQVNRASPSFDAYRGGKLQGLYIQEWSAWRQLKASVHLAMQSLVASIELFKQAEAESLAADYERTAANEEYRTAWLQNHASIHELEAAQAEYDATDEHMQEMVRLECEGDRLWDAYNSGWSYDHTNGGEIGSDYFKDIEFHERTGFNPSGMYAQVNKCEDARAAANAVAKTRDERRAAYLAKTSALSAVFVALKARLEAAYARYEAAITAVPVARAAVWAQVAGSLVQVQDRVGQLLSSSAAIDRAFSEADMASARIDLERSLDTDTVKQRFGLRRRFRSYDLWRARALSENARRLSVAARRAIEARFVLDMSSMTAQEAFVEAPSIWADDIYESDLTPPAAVGRTAGPSGDGIFVNKLVDYVNNLELLVAGWAVERPTANVRSDSEVVQLPGPSEISVPSGSLLPRVSADSAGWLFYCPEAGSWIPHPSFAEYGASPSDIDVACEGLPPTRAKLSFWFDPWGRLNGHTSNPPYTARYNTRWSRFAVNLVGTGVRDCSQAVDSTACYAEPFLPYHLRHVGPAQVTNYEQEWRRLAIPTALVEAGKALAAEQWLDPITNSFHQPYVSNVARGEFVGRPLGGMYEFELVLTPDVRIDAVERIQLLVETSYWVKQSYNDELETQDRVCGDGVLQEGESCDGDCATACDDQDECTADALVGNPLLCNVACSYAPIAECVDEDGCCPDGCRFETDTDCPEYF